ncbi:CapA family protein [Candidatus Venteria ishoeyi]|nr:CapA family protein [Candidatus Venteria ishoeyi]MDM8545798.1 CapA family protein [Candidatus Venteria ishoeyi]
MAVGDMMFGTNYPSAAYLPANEGKSLLHDTAAILRSADLTVGNLEGTILNKGGQVKRCSDPKKCYAFRMPVAYAQHNLKNGGFDAVSIANNHVGDFGQSGRSSTIANLKAMGIQAAGQLSKPTAVFTKNGVRYGFAAFAPNVGTVDLRNIKKAKQIVTQLAKQSDVVIVSFHGGAEGRKYEHVTRKTEKFYGENRGNVYQFAHAVIDAGADLVFGHGPHVTRALELYKGRLIAYSLGNFCTYGRFNLRGINGIAPILQVDVDAQGQFMQGKVISTRQNKANGVYLDANAKVLKRIQQLTLTDFPKTPLKILNNGKIIKK